MALDVENGRGCQKKTEPRRHLHDSVVSGSKDCHLVQVRPDSAGLDNPLMLGRPTGTVSNEDSMASNDAMNKSILAPCAPARGLQWCHHTR